MSSAHRRAALAASVLGDPSGRPLEAAGGRVLCPGWSPLSHFPDSGRMVPADTGCSRIL